MMWPHQIAALRQWPEILLTAVLTFLMYRLAKRRSKTGEWVFFAVVAEISLIVIGGLTALVSAIPSLHAAHPDFGWQMTFYVFYIFAAVLAVVSIPRVIAELRDIVQRTAIAIRRPNLRRLAARNDVEGLWNACLFSDRQIRWRYCFRTEWTEDGTLREQAVLIVARLGRLTGLFERCAKKNHYGLLPVIEQLDERPAPNAAGALFWAVRNYSGILRSAALKALVRQPADELQRCCDWGSLTAVAGGQWEHDAALALDICCKITDPRSAEVLAAAAEGKSRVIRARAAIRMAEHKDPRSVAPLLTLLEEGAYVETVLKALGEIPDRRAVDPVSALLPKLSPHETELALELLARIGDLKAADAIVPLLKNPACAFAAARALSRLNWQPVKGTQAVMLHIANAEWDACVAMGATAVKPLIAALALRDADRVSIVKALGRIGDSRAVEPVCELVKANAAEDLIGAVTGTLIALGASGMLSWQFK